MHIRNLYRYACLADVVDLSIKDRKPLFRSHPIKIGTPFDPYEKKTPSEFHHIFIITKRSSYLFFTVGQITTRLFYVIRASKNEFLRYFRPNACEQHPWYQWVIPLVWVSHSLVVSESHLFVVVIIAAVLSVRYALRKTEKLSIQPVLVTVNYIIGWKM